MAQAIQDARYSVVSHDPVVVTISRAFNGGYYLLIPFSIVVVIFIGGLVYFKSQADSFAENM
jgi:hypothetical protein